MVGVIEFIVVGEYIFGYDFLVKVVLVFVDCGVFVKI